MKDLKEIVKEIKKIETTDFNKIEESRREKEKKRHEKRVVFLRICAKYLETNPRVEFIEKEHDRIVKLIEKIKSDFTIYHNKRLPDGKNFKQIQDEYFGEMNLTTHKRHLKTLEFLMN